MDKSDAVFSLIYNGPYFAASLEAMALRGRLILIGGTAGAKTDLNLATVLRKRLHIIGTVLRARSLQEKNWLE